MPLIQRTDIGAPVTISFTGAFGESPADYTFASMAGPGGQAVMACEIGDPIVLKRLLEIHPPIYKLIGGSFEPSATGMNLTPSPITNAPEPETISIEQARATYQRVVGKKPHHSWDAAKITGMVTAHLRGKVVEAESEAQEERDRVEAVRSLLDEAAEILDGDDSDVESDPAPAE
jgi:hypothetical protein